ncbi:hypothetical protein DTJ15_09015 [Parasaccharibacter sp. TMW 2.1891]|uniref:hypothetical protein n=1 Tax=Parasaccharibacter sp. TMW 2.1891 TaxID=2267836 RepID=UPI002011DC61|nr:hypothetical protein [Parasaccharibacter sp. TMW 2.1891]MCL1514330.1 hypothetical protein [Parasaccharibacter sp. TMW 2.1891]
MSIEMIPDIYLCIMTAFLGEIYPEIRLISADYGEDLVIRVHMVLDRPVNDEDIEEMDCVITEIDAAFNLEDASDIEDRIFFSEEPLCEIEALPYIIYMRYEE